MKKVSQKDLARPLQHGVREVKRWIGSAMGATAPEEDRVPVPAKILALLLAAGAAAFMVKILSWGVTLILIAPHDQEMWVGAAVMTGFAFIPAMVAVVFTGLAFIPESDPRIGELRRHLLEGIHEASNRMLPTTSPELVDAVVPVIVGFWALREVTTVVLSALRRDPASE